jgi:hypothetical protein
MRATRSGFLSQSKKMAGIAIGAVALLAMTGPALSAEAPSKDEVLTLTTAIQTKALTNFDISYIDPVMKKYFLAHRDIKAIDIVDTTNNSITTSAAVFGGIAGGGPNGVWTVNNKEIWAGDGDSTLKVLKADGTLLQIIHVPGTPISPATPKGRVDEGCFDPVDQLVVAGSNQEKPWPWINFITTANGPPYAVSKTIVFDGRIGDGHSTVKATNGIEQCQWDAKTGKIYLNIPEVNGAGNDSSPGAVVVIDPKSKSVENVFTIPLSACAGPMGMAIGPENQILLGCSQNGSNSAIINARSGAVLSILTGYAGTDEVWFNSGDGHYILPFCPASCRITSSPTPEQIGVFDSTGFRADQTVLIASTTTTTGTGSMRRTKSVAADPNTNQVYVPIPAIGGGAPTFLWTICSSAPKTVGVPTDAAGCIAVFTNTE